MSVNIKKTKKKLTIIFSIIVFIIIFLFGTTFFSIKYFGGIALEKKEISFLINVIESGEMSIEDFMEVGTKIGSILNNKIKNTKNSFIKPRGFINYVYLGSNNTIISGDIKDTIDDDLLNAVIKDNIFLELRQESGFLIKKILVKENDGTFILFKKIRYNFSDYMNDALWFLLANIFFVIILYFIGFKFINRTFIPVEDNIKDMKDFIHNASHELKTPISVIDSNIQIIDDIKKYDPEMINELKKEVFRLNSIINGLIKLSNIDGFRDVTNNNLLHSINDIVNEYKFNISEKNIKLQIKIPKNIIIKSSNNYLHIFLSNIIGNSIKYNIDKGTIKLIFKDGSLIIKDSGIGIKKENLNKIFDRFFKGDKSRNSDGFGIGLSIVKKIGDIYGWKIKVDSKIGKGTKFVINF